ncbi:response regulator [Thalassolituus sp.]|uniref:response regulator n=3 Tax=Thalassolituus sp. TaxID=2030822 RepID=UPI003511A562
MITRIASLFKGILSGTHCFDLRAGLLVTCLLLISMRSLAIGPIILPERSFSQTITPYTSFYEDSTARLTLPEILSSNTQLSFTPTHTDSLKRGLTDGVVWIRLSIHNPLGYPLNSVLTLSNARLDEVALYEITDVDTPSEVRGPILKGALNQAHAFSLNINSKSTQSYLIRIKSDTPINTRLGLKSLDQFNAEEQTTDILTGALLGLVTLVLMYFVYALINGERGLIGPGLLCTFSVLFFVPSSIGIYLSLPIAAELPDGCVETFAVCGILASQLWALLQLGWRSLWIRMMLRTGIGFMVVIMATDAITPSYLTEWLLYASTLIIQILTLLLTIRTRSKYPEAHIYLRSSAVVVILGILIVLMNSRSLIDFGLTEQLLVFLLPSFITAGLFFGQIAIGLKRSRKESAGQPTILPETMGQISHELRTPINGVIGMSELMTDTPLSVSQRDYLDTIKMAGEDLQVLVNELSDLGRIKAREIFLDIKPYRLTELLNRTLAHFQQEAIRKQVELILDIADHFPDQLLCDPSRLQSILYNLLSRTLAYTEHGALTVYASYYQGDQAQGLRVQLQLSGTVVKQQELESIFRLLQPGNTKVDSNDPHTWNLTVVRGLLRHMRGTLDIESLNSQGGSITLFLPMQMDNSDTMTQRQQDSSLNGLNVLVVDDNATLRSVIEKQLKRWGINSHSTYSGKEALAMLRTEHRNGTPYDIVIIDHDMPVMSGLQLAERIRSDDEIPRKPANLMLTGLSTNSVERSASAAGIDYVIAKPASGSRLREALAILQKRRTPGY